MCTLRRFFPTLTILSVSFILLTATGAAWARNTITVNSTADTEVSGDGDCTLREALNNANANSDTTGGDCTAGSSGIDTIQFNISGTAPFTIAVTTDLPTITGRVTIDGTTQPGNSGVCTTSIPDRPAYVLTIDGGDLSGNYIGTAFRLDSGSDGSTVKGLHLQGLTFAAVNVRSNNNVIECNFIGTNADGSAAPHGNDWGVWISANAASNTVRYNLISGNNLGMRISASPTNTQIVNNFIGTDRTGTTAIPNNTGIVVVGGTDTDIGTSGNGNLISGNTEAGLFLGGSDVTVVDNLIGTDLTGTAALPNATGIYIGSNGNTIEDKNGGNIISGNTGSGVFVASNASGNFFANNYIGTDITGTLALGNGSHGIEVEGPSNHIGSSFEPRNVISGNTGDGVHLSGGDADHNNIYHNFIGTNAAGTAPLGNGGDGIHITVDGREDILDTDIGHLQGNPSNVIAGNTGHGIYLNDTNGTEPSDVSIFGNYIGTDTTGTLDLGNGKSGIFLDNNIRNSKIGQHLTDPVKFSNTIAFNDGVVVAGNTSYGNIIEQNHIYQNDGLGIDLNNDGVTPNDTGDGDGGPNRLQNYPDFTASVDCSGDLSLAYSLSSSAAAGNTNNTHKLEFFLADADGEEGQTSLLRLNYKNYPNTLTTNLGSADSLGVGRGDVLVATAEDHLDDTSEFSPGVTVGTSCTVDLAVTVIESVDPVMAGSGAGNLTYIATVSNQGLIEATGVALSNVLTLPAGVTVDSVTPSAGSFADPTWTLGDLAAGSSATLTVVVTVDASAASGTDVIANTTSVTAVSEIDTDASNDTHTETTSITREGDLAVTVAESVDPVMAGSGAGNLVYVATVTNQGLVDASGVELESVLTLPSGVTVDSVTPSSGSFSDPTWTLGSLAAGASDSLTITLTVDASAASGTDVIANTTSITAVNEIDTDASNDTETTSVVPPLPFITVTSPNGGESFSPGETLSITWQDNLDENVKIFLRKNGVWVRTITASTESDGRFDWTLQIDLTPGHDYDVRLFSTLDNSVHDHSDNPFSVVTPAQLTATLSDALNADADSDTHADPGDVIAYTAVLTNTGGVAAEEVVFSDTLDAYTALDCASLVLSQGVVTDCSDGAGGAFSASLGSLSSAATLSFRARVASSVPPTLTQIATQGQVVYTGATTSQEVLTDDPETALMGDATVTEIDLSADLALSLSYAWLSEPRPAEDVPPHLVATLTLENHGPVAAQATVPLTLPAGLAFAEKIDATWQTPLLAVGETATLEVALLVTGKLPLSWTVVLGEATLPDPVEENNTVTVTIEGVTGRLGAESEESLAELSGVPTEYALASNYPNPFNPETVIPFAVPVSSEVEIAVYDVVGRRVAVLVSGRMEAGQHEVTFRGEGLSSGLYLVRMQAGSFSQVRQMTLVK